MKLRYLFKIQKIIDNEIRRICQRDGEILDKKNLIKTQILALEVKTGELANLTKCYKYPAPMHHPDKEKLILRYIDCFKFLLSIGNDHHFSIVNVSLKDISGSEESIVDVFLRLFDRISQLKNELCAENYVASLVVYTEIFRDFILVGQILGLTFEEVFAHYDKIYQDMVKHTPHGG